MKIKLSSLLYFYIAVFPILPTYLMLGEWSFSVYFNMAFAGFLILVVVPKIPCLFNKELIFFTIYVAVLMFCNVVHSEYVYAVKTMTSLLFIAVLVVYVIDTKEKFLKAIDILIYIGGIVGVFGVIESVTEFNVFALLNNANAVLNYNELRFGLLRIISFTSQTITYANYASIIACLAFYRINMTSEKKKRIFILIYILMCVNVILTMSRSVILCFVLSQIVLFIMCGFWKFVKRALLAGIVLLAISFITSLAFSGIEEAINNFVNMFLAVFDEESYNSVSQSVDNTGGVGHRFSLYEWVWDDVSNSKFLGKGLSAKFLHIVKGREKTSIEVQYLYTLFHYGLLGMIAEIFMYISILVNTLLRFNKPYSFENTKLSFSKVCFVLFLSQFLSYFAVMQDMIDRTFYIVLFLLFAYMVNLSPKHDLRQGVLI